MFDCICVIVGFKSFIKLMLFAKCIYAPTLNTIYLLETMTGWLIIA